MGLTPLGGGDISSYKHSSHSGSELCCRVFPLRAPTTQPVVGISLTREQQRAKLPAGISPSQKLNFIAGISPTQRQACRYCRGTNPTRELHDKTFQMSRSQSNSPSRYPATKQSQNKQGKIQTMLHFKVTAFIIKFSDYIHPTTNLATSEKSNTRSITCL